MNRYNIRKISIWPAFKFGAVIGAVLAIVPGILGGLFARSAVGSLSNLLAGMSLLTLGNPGLADFAQWLTKIDQQGALTVLWVALGSILGSGLAYGISTALGALIYNLVASISGGLVVSAEILAAQAPAAVPAAQPAPVLPQPPVPAPARPAMQSAPQYQPVQVPVVQAAPPVQPPVAQPVQAPPVIQPSGPWLALGANPAQRWSLRPDCTRLGSAAGNEIVLPGLAPQHAEIRQENGIYVLYDLTAGQSWVNGRPVAGRNMLKEGFQIRLGGQDLVFHAG